MRCTFWRLESKDGDIITAFKSESSQPTDLSRLVKRMKRGEFDLIAVGRALLG